MHDCSIATGDAWVKRFVSPLLDVPDTVVFVVFDEGERGNQVAALALGTAVRPHSVFTRRVDHYGLLRTIEQMQGLPPLGAAAKATTIDGIWK
jgi:acid phosphatase